jgi:hypothetical protein
MCSAAAALLFAALLYESPSLSALRPAQSPATGQPFINPFVQEAGLLYHVPLFALVCAAA